MTFFKLTLRRNDATKLVVMIRVLIRGVDFK